MCDRYVLPDQGAAEREFLPALAWWKFAARFNVAPQQYVPAVRVHDGQTEGMMIRWGLIPSWAEGQPTESPTASADIDGLERSIIYRMPWLSGQRCILPVAGKTQISLYNPDVGFATWFEYVSTSADGAYMLITEGAIGFIYGL